MTPGLYVPYRAAVAVSGVADGYVIIRNRSVPTTRREVEEIMKIIKDEERLQAVYPLAFIPLEDVS